MRVWRPVALLLFIAQFLIVVWYFDIAVRDVMSHELTAGHVTPDFERGVRALRERLIPYRVWVLACGTGLYVLFLTCAKRRPPSAVK